MHFPQPLCACVLIAALILSSSPNAFAKGAKEGETARAERSSGIVALNLGRYDEAAQHFESAYTLMQDPVLLFSLGQAYRLAGRPEKALAAYNSFLRASTYSPKNRSQYEMVASEIAIITSVMTAKPAAPPAATEAQLDDLMKAREAKMSPAKTLEPPPVNKEAKEEQTVAEPVADAEKLEPPKALDLSTATVAVAAKTEGQIAGVSMTNNEPPPPPQENGKSVYKKWWFWTSVAGALALGGAATWWFTRPEATTPPSTWGAQRVLP
jgi:hypothetical protein